MDTIFWIGIIIGAVLSLMASIVANLLNLKINALWDNQRNKLKLKQEEKEKRIFELVRDFHEGRRDKAIYFTLRSTSNIGTLMISLAAGFTSIYASNKYGPMKIQNDIFMDYILYFLKFSSPLCLVIFLVLSYSYALSTKRLSDLSDKLDSFEQYKKELGDRFPQSNFWKS